jgi:hypothetical protein
MSMGWERDVTSKFAGHGVLWGGVVVEHLPCICKALGSIPHTWKKMQIMEAD